jgi:benzoylformate decarboxylase
MSNVREAVFDVLRSHGVTTVFGNPGYTELPFLEHFPEDFTFVAGLQEASVVSMADGWAQAARKPAVVVLHSQAGLGNAVGSIMTAYSGGTPLVIVSGQQQREMLPGEPLFFIRDARDIPQPFVRWSHEPARAADVPAAFARALAMATQSPSGPVYLAVPLDDWSAEAAPAPERRIAHRVASDPDALAAAAAALDASRRPALVLGAGVDRSGAWDDVVRLAERVRAQVYIAPNAARQSFPADHALYRGGLPPVQKALSDMLGGHDVALVLGAAVFDYMASQPGDVIPASMKLFQFTVDREEAARALAGDAAVGDPGLVIAELLRLTSAGKRADPEPGAQAPPVEPGSPMSADAVLELIEARRPRDSIVLVEVSSHLSAVGRRIRVTRPSGFYFAGRGGLGFAMPCAVGVALAEPHSRAIAIVGDGASLYSFQSLWTAVGHRAPVTIIVLNNGGYNSLKASAELMGLTPTIPGLDVPGVDHVKLAEGFGCPAVRVETLEALANATDRAFAGEGPNLIDVAVDPTVRSLLS